MIESHIGTVEGSELVFFQCVDDDEVKAAGLPHGAYYYWEFDGKRITSPGEVVAIILRSAQRGTLNAAEFIQTKAINEHYQSLRSAQMNSIQDHIKKMRDYYSKIELPENLKKQVLQQLDESAKLYEGESFPNTLGLSTPNREAVDRLMGKDFVAENFTPEQIKQTFGED